MNSRLSILSGLLPETTDSAIIISNENRRYFTDFVSSSGYLLVTKSESCLFVDSRYSEAAQKQAKDCTVIAYKKLREALTDIINQKQLKSIMLEGSAFTLNNAAELEKIITSANAQTVKTDKLDKIINLMRITKTADEVEKMCKAQRITEDALTDTLKLIKEGVTEKELALELEFKMRKAGADGVSFDLIVITGKKTSMPHGVPGYEKVQKGDFILFDIGATVDGYHSDMTRTVAFGNIDNAQKRVYETVRQAQLNGLAAVRNGAVCGEVDNAARSYIHQAGFENCFGHSTGHGVGLEIHEEPYVSPDNDFILRNGMVITVEPGIYIPEKFGVRIEDMVVVTSEGCINLATFSKDLIVL